jgi:hypothetical protein
MIETIKEGFLLALGLSAIGLYLWLVFSASAWLWRRFVAWVDDRINHSVQPVTNRVIVSMWQVAKETPVIFFAPAILLWRGFRTATVRYMNEVDQLVAQRK